MREVPLKIVPDGLLSQLKLMEQCERVAIALPFSSVALKGQFFDGKEVAQTYDTATKFVMKLVVTKELLINRGVAHAPGFFAHIQKRCRDDILLAVYGPLIEALLKVTDQAYAGDITTTLNSLENLVRALRNPQ